MAKYTKLFADYIEGGGELPAAFDLIEGFEDLFKKYYCDKEIGFETDLLFAMKLELYADMYVPVYAARIAKETAAWAEFDTPVKTTHETDDTTFNAGATRGTITDLPLGASGSNPNTITAADAYENTNGRELERTESGATSDEAIARLRFIQDKVKVIKLELLERFAPCVMAVY